MNAQILTFSANEQTLIKTGGIDDFASNTVRYAKATFTLGTNWTGFDSVRAVWKTACYTISTVLDANHSCDVPPEVLSYKAKVYVNLVGSISENGVLTDRLTTFPVLAMHIKSNAPVEGTETAPVTASQFEQFVETVQNAAESISDYSYDSEAWAVGKRGGVDVPSTDETYHNNSKYWAEQNAGLSDEVADLKEDITHNWDLYQDESYSIPLDLLNFRNVQLSSGGNVVETADPRQLVSEMINIPHNAFININFVSVTNLDYIKVFFYNNSGTVIRGQSLRLSSAKSVLVNSDNGDNVRIAFTYTANTLPSALTDNLTVDVTYRKDVVTYSSGKNLFNPNDPMCLDGYYIVSSTGELQTSGSYGVSGFIPVKSGQKIVISPSLRHFLFYNNSLFPDANYWVGSAQSNYVFTPPQDGYVRFTYYKSNKSSQQVEIGDTPTTYEPYVLNADSGINYLNDANKAWISSEIEDKIDEYAVDYSIGNVLYGKKWAVCGDSFTDGVLGTVIGEGKYADKSVVYPYLIGNRNNMDIVKFFVGGQTLAYPSDNSFTNSLTYSLGSNYYQNIPADADYITIYLGINDSHHEPASEGNDGEETTGEIPLGTISDNTVNTYYGAWNVVLTWLMTNRPFAHIGIIVSNGCDREAYRTAQLEIAQKYGIPYIDMNGDSRTPVMIRSKNPNIASAVKTIINEKQRVSSSNMHPNDNAHIYESYFIENFLRTL